ncbi:hypothetical protein D3H55_23460 [Bacillus salacetis]|uniref:Uncharacterized protein n=1 Tax=Bacillus salacetis TaxID=2315464 RepID=A0A3A1QL74_9BACI|nr:hypothetical protein D3H55_23460 [Bacillus salacetis]
MELDDLKRNRLDQPRQASDKPAGRGPFSLLDGLAYDPCYYNCLNKKIPGICLEFDKFREVTGTH